MSEKVIMAMSGGVDSTVSTHLLKEQGYDVIGITLKMFEGQEDLLEDARKMAGKLNIEWHMVDCTDYFKEDVMSYFFNTYRKGKTPNPCCYCNKYAKFSYLFDTMQRFNADKMATGHYARKSYSDGKYCISKGKNSNKDQSYYLCLLDEFYINLIEFPLGNFENKYQVREIAENLGLEVANKKGSQDVCFTCGMDYREYIRKYIDDNKMQKGNFIFDDKVLKKHEGIELYTVGQRKGLNTGYHKPLYVKKINPETCDIFLDTKENIYFKGVILENCNFIIDKKFFKGKVKLRYRMKEAECFVEKLPSHKAVLLFDEKQLAPAPGQVAAIYNGKTVVGGGFIKEVF